MISEASMCTFVNEFTRKNNSIYSDMVDTQKHGRVNMMQYNMVRKICGVYMWFMSR